MPPVAVQFSAFFVSAFLMVDATRNRSRLKDVRAVQILRMTPPRLWLQHDRKPRRT